MVGFLPVCLFDIFSRRVVGWCIADAEDTALFKALFDETFARHGVPPGQLTLHADRGGPMTAKATAFLLADLGVTKSPSSLSELSCQAAGLAVPEWRAWGRLGRAFSRFRQLGTSDSRPKGRDRAATASILPVAAPFGAQAAAARANSRFTL